MPPLLTDALSVLALVLMIAFSAYLLYRTQDLEAKQYAPCTCWRQRLPGSGITMWVDDPRCPRHGVPIGPLPAGERSRSDGVLK